MSELKITGTITKILDVQSGTSKSGNEWIKTGFVINTGGEYPKDVAFTVFGSDRVSNFQKFNKVGHLVEVSFEPESREYEGRFYTDLSAWRTMTLNKGNEAPEPVVAQEEDDDLPF